MPLLLTFFQHIIGSLFHSIFSISFLFLWHNNRDEYRHKNRDSLTLNKTAVKSFRPQQTFSIMQRAARWSYIYHIKY